MILIKRLSVILAGLAALGGGIVAARVIKKPVPQTPLPAVAYTVYAHSVTDGTEDGTWAWYSDGEGRLAEVRQLTSGTYHWWRLADGTQWQLQPDGSELQY